MLATGLVLIPITYLMGNIVTDSNSISAPAPKQSPSQAAQSQPARQAAPAEQADKSQPLEDTRKPQPSEKRDLATA
jgi:hypothetical protein